MTEKKGFTLIELIVVLALIAILVLVLIVALRPQEIFKRARDTQRQGDLRTLATAIDAIFAETIQGLPPLDNANLTKCVGTTTNQPFLWYSVSLTGAATFTATSPIMNSAQTWQRSGTTSRAIDGNGWLPIPFKNYPIVALEQLPIDPTNSQSNSLYYTYSCYNGSQGTHYELNARLEGSDAGANDGGDIPGIYERGSSLKILPGATTAQFYGGQ